MGGVCCCFAEPIDFNAEINLYHFDLHRAVGKGAFGKVAICRVAARASSLTARGIGAGGGI